MGDSADEMTSNGSWKELAVDFDTAIARLPDALGSEGFGIITQIDMQQTFKAKLGVDFRRYRIFGACNPAFALQALATDPRAGLLLPCNVVIYERADKTAVLGIVDPVRQLGAAHDDLRELAKTISDKLQHVARVVDS